MPTYTADWIVPIAEPPLAGGWIATRDGVILASGRGAPPPAADPVVACGAVAILPALVNAHTHLELSWLRGRVPPAGSFVDWVSAMMRVRLGAPDAADTRNHRAAMAAAAAEMRASGTGLVGDVSNSLEGTDLVADVFDAGVVFHELLGFRTPDPAGLVVRAMDRVAALPSRPGWRVALAPHAPYSVSPELFAAIAAAAPPDAPIAVHVAEGAEERDLMATGTGRWRDLLQAMGVWDEAWPVPGCSPVTYLDRLGLWSPRALAVHAVQASRTDLALLGERGATVVTCPRSNRYVGAGDPPAAGIFASGVRVAVGTDSLSSVEDLNLFAELARLHELAPGVAPARLLEAATLGGASALGLAGDWGTLEPGRRAALVGVAVPPGLADVEQYLVGGIMPHQVQWIESGRPC